MSKSKVSENLEKKRKQKEKMSPSELESLDSAGKIRWEKNNAKNLSSDAWKDGVFFLPVNIEDENNPQRIYGWAQCQRCKKLVAHDKGSKFV